MTSRSASRTPPPLVVYSDMDGTLLDHHSYSHAAAQPMLEELERRNIPLVLCTSKTRAEVLWWRSRLSNHHPFIIENGAAVLIPPGYFAEEPTDLTLQGGLLVHSFVQPREHWLRVVARAEQRFAASFRQFSRLDAQQIAELTGLELAMAELAAERQYGEALCWDGSEPARLAFIDEIERLGARVLQGGRFLHVSGQCDKGVAMNWLHRLYTQHYGQRTVSLACGDSENDRQMLETSDTALIVRSPVNPPPNLQRGECFISDQIGPRGWYEGIREILALLDAGQL